jgi:hypothetical protein
VQNRFQEQLESNEGSKMNRHSSLRAGLETKRLNADLVLAPTGWQNFGAQGRGAYLRLLQQLVNSNTDPSAGYFSDWPSVTPLSGASTWSEEHRHISARLT